MTSTAEPLVEYLRQLERQGQTHVHLDETARKVLRVFYQRAKGIKVPAQRVTASQSQPQKPQAKASATEPAVKQAVVTAAPAAPVKARTLESIKQQMAVAPVFKSLQSLRQRLVFSEGDPKAKIMFVGEAPGYEDERQGKPFVGPAGKKLEAIMKAMGLSREEVYLTHLVKYRPAIPQQTTNGRPPNAQEIAASLPYLLAEIEQVKPEVVVVLGATVARSVIGPKVEDKDLLGRFHEVHGVKVRATYNPSYLLYKEVTPQKRHVWQDMLAVMEQVGMPISEKQRGFFSEK